MKVLVRKDQFIIVNRRAHHAAPVSSSVAKIVVANLTMKDFIKCELDRDESRDYIWIYVTDVGITYYLKFKFINNFHCVKFISFHPSIEKEQYANGKNIH